MMKVTARILGKAEMSAKNKGSLQKHGRQQHKEMTTAGSRTAAKTRDHWRAKSSRDARNSKDTNIRQNGKSR
jgi:hypothetical protein